jgi:hypothetical protein
MEGHLSPGWEDLAGVEKDEMGGVEGDRRRELTW